MGVNSMDLMVDPDPQILYKDMTRDEGFYTILTSDLKPSSWTPSRTRKP